MYVSNTVLKEAHTSRALVNKIRTRHTTFFDNVMRREKLEHLIKTGMMEGKRSRGKQREKMTDGLVKWLGAGKVVEILKATRDRGIWKDMIANAIKHGTGWWWWCLKYANLKREKGKISIYKHEWHIWESWHEKKNVKYKSSWAISHNKSFSLHFLCAIWFFIPLSFSYPVNWNCCDCMTASKFPDNTYLPTLLKLVRFIHHFLTVHSHETQWIFLQSVKNRPLL